jgi:hypothetical protein
MTVEQANSICIRQFLAVLNILPVKEKDRYGMYSSPLHPDSEPSFKVDYRQNSGLISTAAMTERR